MAAPRLLEAGHGEPGLVHDPVERLAMRRRERRPFEVFSLSFLDVHLLRLRRHHPALRPHQDGRARGARAGAAGPRRPPGPARGGARARSAGETTVLNRDLRGREQQLSEERLKVARLQGDLSRVQGQFAASQELSAVQDIIAGRLLAAQQELTEEMKRLQKQRRRPTERPARRAGRAASRSTASTSSSSSTPRAACSASPGRWCGGRWTRCSTPTRR